jgi:hypothetical protein
MNSSSDSNAKGNSASSDWADEELSGGVFADPRHGKRLHKLLKAITFGKGGSMPWSCQDWASIKAAYRFFSNPRVSPATILSGHLNATRKRFEAVCGQQTVLVLHDTTEFVYKRKKMEAIGLLKTAFMGNDSQGRSRLHTLCGLLMHSSLVVTRDGVPLGLAAVHFWTRKKFKGTTALKKRINSTRQPIEGKESRRWVTCLRRATRLLAKPEAIVHVGDRESDIYELFAAAKQERTHFLFRTCVDRLTGSQVRVSALMAEVRVKGLHRVEVQDKDGNTALAVLELRYRRLRLLPPEGKKKRYPELDLTVLHAEERGTPENREAINWKLVTDLPIHSRQQAIEKLNWYALRWKIETFHKILKSGARAEEAKLRTAPRLVNLIAVLCILSWRIFWMTMINRATPEADPRVALTETELLLLQHTGKQSKALQSETLSSLNAAILAIAKLGGYLHRAKDPPPGNFILWRGLARLTDIQLGFLLAKQLVGK